jgi:hypothetical protein
MLSTAQALHSLTRIPPGSRVTVTGTHGGRTFIDEGVLVRDGGAFLLLCGRGKTITFFEDGVLYQTIAETQASITARLEAPPVSSDGRARPVGGEPTHKKNRADTLPAIRTAVEAVLLPFHDGRKFDSPSVQEDLERFVEACAQRQERADLAHWARAVVDHFIKARDVTRERLEAILATVIEAGTGPTRMCLFDGPSIPFPLGNGATVKVLVRKGTTVNSADSPLHRHTMVKAFQSAVTSEVVNELVARNNPLPLFYGASGSGKTVCGMALVASLDRPGISPGACIRIRCSADWFTFGLAQAPKALLDQSPLLRSRGGDVFDIHAFEETYKSVKDDAQSERDQVAQHFVISAIDTVINNKHRNAPKEQRVLVVLLDEAGECPTFVRAMCGCYAALQLAMSARYSEGDCLVRLVVAGTNVERADHRVGSEHTTVFLYHVRTRTWPLLKAALPKTAKAATDLLDKEESTLMRIINGMVQNARVAANLACQLEQLSNLSLEANLVELDPGLALKSAAVAARQKYRCLNSRGELSDAADFAVMLRAMAQQTLLVPLHSLAKYGLLVDRAEPWLKTTVDEDPDLAAQLELVAPHQDGKGFYLHRCYHGVRYELELAQTMMLQLKLKIGDHPVADFIAMAMELSRKELGMNFASFNTRPPWTMQSGWQAPLMLVERLRRDDLMPIGCAPHDTKAVTDVIRIFSTRKLEPTDSTDEQHASSTESEPTADSLEAYISTYILRKQRRVDSG